ncbi:MAG: GNAT family N-acetyltransferase [bacterium]|nr:GNAT family N-acetyltransferase [bacterium]
MAQSIRDQATVRRAGEQDLRAMAEINTASFAGNQGDVEKALEWVRCWFRAFPLYQYFVVQVEDKVAGYVGWQLHGGFLRSQPVIELEQVAVAEQFQGQGLAPRLCEETMDMVVEWVCAQNPHVQESVIAVVWVYTINDPALAVYARQFRDQVQGMRNQYGHRSENMLRATIPIDHHRQRL